LGATLCSTVDALEDAHDMIGRERRTRNVIGRERRTRNMIGRERRTRNMIGREGRCSIQVIAMSEDRISLEETMLHANRQVTTCFLMPLRASNGI